MRKELEMNKIKQGFQDITNSQKKMNFGFGVLGAVLQLFLFFNLFWIQLSVLLLEFCILAGYLIILFVFFGIQKSKKTGLIPKESALFLIGWISCCCINYGVVLLLAPQVSLGLFVGIMVVLWLLFGVVNLIWQCIYQSFPELIRYLVGGFFTFVISMMIYRIATNKLLLTPILAQVISWIFSVTFAFFINKYWVFSHIVSQKSIWFELINFVTGRLVTSAVIEAGLFSFMVYALSVDDMVTKVITTVLVVVANYFWSKLLTFRSQTKE